MDIVLPELALVLLVGPAGAGKSTFAKKHFKPTEVVSSDSCRALISDDESEQSVTPAAFELLRLIVRLRLRRRRLTVVDAVNARAEDRRSLVALAREQDCAAVALVFDLSEDLCVQRDSQRPGRKVGARAVHMQRQDLLGSLGGLGREGFAEVFRLDAESADQARVRRVPLTVNRRWEHGPFDVIGDVHGCMAELEQLLRRLGYQASPAGEGILEHPQGRKAVFVGDLVDRGPDTPGVLRTVMAMAGAKSALGVLGNHDDKLKRALLGRPVSVRHGLELSLRQLGDDEVLKGQALSFLQGLPGHLVLDGGALVVAHAGIKAAMQGRDSARVRRFSLYGETAGEVDELGMPVRLDWATDYRGRALVVYGHAAVSEPRWLRRTVNVDTGCVFGGGLTALRFPELELVTVPAFERYVPAPG